MKCKEILEKLNQDLEILEGFDIEEIDSIIKKLSEINRLLDSDQIDCSFDDLKSINAKIELIKEKIENLKKNIEKKLKDSNQFQKALKEYNKY